MIVADFVSLPQWLTTVVAWVGALTGIGSLIILVFNLRKIAAETKEIHKRIALMDRKQAIHDAAMVLWLRASRMNSAIDTREGWASVLKDPSLVDDALTELGATVTPAKEPLWEIPLSPRQPMERDVR